MIIKEVVEKAVEYIKNFYGETVSGLMLEEIRHSDDNKTWLITLSFTREKPQRPSTVAFITGGADAFERVYKQIEINAENGEFIGMTIRSI